MLQSAKDLQTKAVDALVNLVTRGTKKEITFKSPTGSVKTYMMASFMERVLSERQDIVFIVSALSKGDLARQNYEKFSEYQRTANFTHLIPHLINTEISSEERLFIPLDSNIYILPMGLSKRDGLLFKEGALKSFLDRITGHASLFFPNDAEKTTQKKIVLIKDECHIATKNLDSLGEYFTKTVNFSATPNLKRGQEVDIEVRESSAIGTSLIKNIVWESERDALKDNSERMRLALENFLDLKERYKSLGISPAFLIQISNKEKADDEVKLAKEVIESVGGNTLKWMLVVDKLKDCDTNDSLGAKKLPPAKWKDYLKDNVSTIDIVIFKMVITEGFDMPRACVLFQMRETKSKQLDEQVLGRVRRNPRLLDFEKLETNEQKLLTTAFVYGMRPKDYDASLECVSLKLDSHEPTIDVETTKLAPLSKKKDFSFDAFLSSRTPFSELKNKHGVLFDFFKSARALLDSSPDVQELIYSYVGNDIEKWFLLTYYLPEIEIENRKYMCDYSESMEKSDTVSLPLRSFSSFDVKSQNYTEISDWVWEKSNSKDAGEKDYFHFDSAAERLWADFLRSISRDVIMKDRKLIDVDSQLYLWGKNYPVNSSVKFEYYSDTNHYSYPDFVMKDRGGRIHIFEVKSFEKSKDSFINEAEYETKTRELGELFRAASKLTGQYFYIPERTSRGGGWQVWCYQNGEEGRKMNLDEFKTFLINLNKER